MRVYGYSGLIAVLAWSLCALVSSACLENPAVTCKNGQICAPGNVCDDAHGGCATQSQIVACTGKAAEAACSYPGTSDGACYEGVCLPSGCGNGVMATDEVCDDGNRMHGDGCSADCQSRETCGNGVIDAFITPPEQCDDGNNADDDTCHANCTLPICGDGITDAQFNEACDDGVNNSNTVPDACRPNCQRHFCGDHVIDSDEVCDDGNSAAGDLCFYNCQSDETCGNGYVDVLSNELCDDGDTQSNDGCGSCLPEEVAWATAGPAAPPARQLAGIAFDAARGRLVMFGGLTTGDVMLGDTWEWNGNAWIQMTPSSASPSPRCGAELVFDAARGRIVMFGGSVGGFVTDETWEWNGNAWTNVTPLSGSPSARSGHAMVYDAARKRVVLFGGPLSNDTWEWNGSAWTNVTPTSGNPIGRTGHALAYDAARGRVVLFGGFSDINRGINLNDTWEWNGTAWTDVTPSSGNPVARVGHRLAYDVARGKVTLFGGLQDGGDLADTWEWNGTAWANVTPSSSNPLARWNHAFAYDALRGRLVLFAGFSHTDGYFSDTWEWNGTAWTVVTPAPSTPSGRSMHASAYDDARGRLVLFGGFGSVNLGDTWEWNGSTWRDVTPASGNPSARSRTAMAYDAARGRIVMFGGNSGGYLGDTWEWNGSAWANVTPASGNPPARYGHAVAYDAARDRIVLFGGRGNGGLLDDTWEWNGSAWTNVTAVSGNPPARGDHAMVYDAARQRVVLFGGNALSGNLGDTWEWNGSVWTDVTPTTISPSARYSHGLAYDAAFGRVVLFGGQATSFVNDTWAWDGTRWTILTPTVNNPVSRRAHALTYDAARRRIVLFGGYPGGSATLNDTWTLRSQNAAPDERCAYGFDGDSDQLVGCTDPDCFGYCTPSCNPTIMTCNPALPYCGDGMCQAIETNRLCPSDCDRPTPSCGDFLCDSPETSASCPGDCSPGVPAPAVGDLAINEFMAADNLSDTNCDGSTASANDEFIELVNVSNKTLDLNGVTVADAIAIRHTFSSTILPPGESIVLWSGGVPTIKDACANVERAAVASTGLLALNDATDTITIALGSTPLITVTYAQATPNKSFNLSPELMPNNPATPTNYVLHDTLPGAQGTYSPGTRSSGASF